MGALTLSTRRVGPLSPLSRSSDSPPWFLVSHPQRAPRGFHRPRRRARHLDEARQLRPRQLARAHLYTFHSFTPFIHLSRGRIHSLSLRAPFVAATAPFSAQMDTNTPAPLFRPGISASLPASAPEPRSTTGTAPPLPRRRSTARKGRGRGLLRRRRKHNTRRTRTPTRCSIRTTSRALRRCVVRCVVLCFFVLWHVSTRKPAHNTPHTAGLRRPPRPQLRCSLPVCELKALTQLSERTTHRNTTHNERTTAWATWRTSRSRPRSATSPPTRAASASGCVPPTYPLAPPTALPTSLPISPRLLTCAYATPPPVGARCIAARRADDSSCPAAAVAPAPHRRARAVRGAAGAAAMRL